MNLILFPTLKG